MPVNRNSQSFLKRAFIKEVLILTILFAVSLLIRWISLKHGFPLLLHPDEGVILDTAFFMTKEGFFYPGNPGNYIRPNQILYLINFLYLNLMSYLRFGENFASRYQLYELHFYHYARLLIAVMGSLIPLVAYKIGKLFKPAFGLMAGLTFAVFPSYVLHSLYITPDIPITLFTLIVIYFTLRYLINNENISLYAAILFAAINTAEKYPGVISMVIVAAGILIKTFEKSEEPIKAQLWPAAKQLLIAGVCFFLALFLVAPKLFIHYQMTVAGFLHSSRSTHAGADYLGLFGRLFFYIRAFASWSNILAVVWIGAGCYAAYKWRNKPILLLSYGVLYWVSLSLLALHWERWALPMYITPLFLIAIGISFIWERYKATPKMKWVTLALIVLFFAEQGISSLQTSISRGFTDTRVVALEFAQTNGITPENSLYEGYTPFQVRQAPTTIFEEYKNQEEDFLYVILSSHMYERFYQEPERYAQELSVYESIRNENLLMARFEPDPPAEGFAEKVDDILFFARRSLNKTTIDRYRGPVIEIYQVGN